MAQQLTPPRPKEFQVQISAGKVLALIFWDQDGIILIDYLTKGPKYQRGVLLISAGAIEGYFEGKTPTPWEGHQGGLVLAWQIPGSLGTCNLEETGLPRLPMSWSSSLFSGSDPVRLAPVPWTEKNNRKFTIFCPTRSLLRRPGWTDNFLNFFLVDC